MPADPVESEDRDRVNDLSSGPKDASERSDRAAAAVGGSFSSTTALMLSVSLLSRYFSLSLETSKCFYCTHKQELYVDRNEEDG